MNQFTKLVAGRLKAQPAPGPHPAPEQLSAFAENALPDADRRHMLQHLGACPDCREILYLALPETVETQKVLVPQPRPFRRWGLGWGALVASVAVVAIFFTTNRLELKDQRVSTVPPAPAAATEPKIAANATPAELDQMQAARDADKARASTALSAAESKPQPDAKHMTAKLQPELVFEDSGEVRVRGQQTSADAAVLAKKEAGNPDAYARPATAPSTTRADQPASAGKPVAADAISESNSEQAFAIVAPPNGTVALKGRDTVNLQSPSRVAAAPQPAAASANGAFISTAGGNLDGVILDSSGAVVGNAKVTMAGPAGAKTVTTDSEGKFSFAKLPPGLYTIKAEANGFRSTEIKHLAVLDNKTSTVPVTLEVGATSDAVEVTGAADAVEANAWAAPPQPAAQLSMQKATAARVKRQALAGAIGSGAGAATISWTLSPEGAVQRSGDGGKNWQPVSIESGTGPFQALSAVGANIWVAGKAGALYRSSDSGQTWAKVTPVAGGKKLDQDITRLDFPDASTGTVNTANGEVWTTSDGGQTWQLK
jgi:hypothetical protein